ncbi:hypothetical protein VTO42DRAFT_6475 [Malbranchea cinnamomea]
MISPVIAISPSARRIHSYKASSSSGQRSSSCDFLCGSRGEQGKLTSKQSIQPISPQTSATRNTLLSEYILRVCVRGQAYWRGPFQSRYSDHLGRFASNTGRRRYEFR